MTTQARTRRLQDTLIIAGGGVIAFAAWTFAKTTLLVIVYGDELWSQLPQIDEGVSIQLLYFIIAIAAAIDLAIRLFVGFSARAEGRGKQKGIAYLAVASLLAVASVSSAVVVALGISGSSSIVDSAMGLLIETTSASALVLVIYCAIRLRRFRTLQE